MSAEGNSDGGWPGGWFIAVAAGVFTAVLARWLGDIGTAAVVLVGIFVFLVFGVLLGMFWAAPAPASGEHGHDDQDGHDDQSHGDQSHAAAPAPVMDANPVAPPLPTAPVPAVAAVEIGGAAKPAGLTGPRSGMADKLQTIEGIGPALEKLCHELGIYHFDQIASWGTGEVAWMDGNLKGFKGRVTRDKWVRQAKLIGEVGIEEFLRRAKTNDY